MSDPFIPEPGQIRREIVSILTLAFVFLHAVLQALGVNTNICPK